MCFSAAWWQNLLIYLVILGAIFAILKILLPYVLSALGAGGGVIMAVINVIMWAFIAILVIYICFALISCLGGVGHLSLMPR